MWVGDVWGEDGVRHAPRPVERGWLNYWVHYSLKIRQDVSKESVWKRRGILKDPTRIPKGLLEKSWEIASTPRESSSGIHKMSSRNAEGILQESKWNSVRNPQDP